MNDIMLEKLETIKDENNTNNYNLEDLEIRKEYSINREWTMLN